MDMTPLYADLLFVHCIHLQCKPFINNSNLHQAEIYVQKTMVADMKRHMKRQEM